MADSDYETNISKRMLIVSASIAIVLMSIIWATAWYYREKFRLATEHGYGQKQIQGSQSVYWTKD